MQLISAPSKTRGRWKRQAGHAEHPLHLWCHACCPLIQVPRAGFVPPSDSPPPPRHSFLSQTASPPPDIPTSLRHPSLSHTFFSLLDIRPFLRQPSLSQTIFPLRHSSLSHTFSLFPEQSSLSQDILTSPRHPSSSQKFSLLPDIFPLHRQSAS